MPNGSNQFCAGRVDKKKRTRFDIKKPDYLLNSRVSLCSLGWLMGLEPTTTGITILTFYYSLSLINTLQSI